MVGFYLWPVTLAGLLRQLLHSHSGKSILGLTTQHFVEKDAR